MVRSQQRDRIQDRTLNIGTFLNLSLLSLKMLLVQKIPSCTKNSDTA